MFASKLGRSRMDRNPIWVLFISLLLVLQITDSAVDQVVKDSLISFLAKLNGTTGEPDPSFGWNNATDPCQDQWTGVVCDDPARTSVKKISLNDSSLSGVLDVSSLCNVQAVAESLVLLKLDRNNVVGNLSADIGNCRYLTHLLIGHNQISGELPDSLAMLNNLKRLDISYNIFSGKLPLLSRISGLTMFLAQHNQLTGIIPKFDFSNLEKFNVSYNNLSGQIPDVNGKFDESCFMHNDKLCGLPLQNACLLTPSESNPTSDGKKSKADSKDRILMYSGYGTLASVFVAFIIWRLYKRKRTEQKYGSNDVINKVRSVDESMKPSAASSDSRASKSEFSANSVDSAYASSSMIVVTSPVVNGLKFDDLLRAPAELLGRGKHGSLYKVVYENGMILAVKRIKDWAISSSEFKQRMQKIYQANHPNVLLPLAFYSSRHEKLLVYEYQPNGSLFKFLHDTQVAQAFDWLSRLNVAAKIAEALAFMHQELRAEGISHGNLKSSNILVNKNMEPCISEYGLKAFNNEEASDDLFKSDIYGFGVILLELLTGKLVHTNGIDLTTWVQSFVREEWTVEVFDKSLILEGASEERMLNLLHVAIKCINRSPESRPSTDQLAHMINTIKEEEERSITYDP